MILVKNSPYLNGSGAHLGVFCRLKLVFQVLGTLQILFWFELLIKLNCVMYRQTSFKDSAVDSKFKMLLTVV
jgi:hypothetical protein